MIQAHCYDSWITPEARKGEFYRYSQLISTMAAPLFLLLCGVSFALVTERMWAKHVATSKIFRTALRRAAEIFGIGLLLRVQEYVLGYPTTRWSDLFKVDVLNILGISIALMAVLWRVAVWLRPSDGSEATGWRGLVMAASLVIAAVIALVTPPLFSTYQPRFLPWMLESYINGVHNYGTPEPWIFSIFPWCGFAFVGLAFGLFLFTDFARAGENRSLLFVGGVGVAACVVSLWFDALPVKFYAIYDYWRDSPNFFLMRCGILLLLVPVTYAWCRWGWATRGFSPAIVMGQASLLVYWAHIEFVYGRLSILPKFKTSIPLATVGMAVIFAASIALAGWRTNSRMNSKETASRGIEVVPAGAATAPVAQGSFSNLANGSVTSRAR
jgi:heparan-alpha-glucosaminide N-acetyltransferase-like protein